MVETDRTDRVEPGGVVFVRRIVAVPADHIQRRMREGRGPQAAAVFLHALGRPVDVLERRHGRLEIAVIGQAVRADRPEVRQAEEGTVVLADIAADRAGTFDPEPHPARNDHDLAGSGVDPPHLGDEGLVARLRHDQQLAVGAVEDPVDHRSVGRIQMDADARQRLRIARPAIGDQPLDPVGRRGRQRQGIPAHPVRRRRRVMEGSGPHQPLGERPVGRVLRARPQPVQPRPPVLAARRREGRPRQLLRIQPHRCPLR